MFKSFFIAGFDCTAGYNACNIRINHTAATQHDIFLAEDYRRLQEVGIHAAREGICWSDVDCRGHYDFSSVRSILNASKRYDIEIIYDLCHFGYPEDLNVFSREFARRFADYCYAVARYIAANTDGMCYFTPINEPSYFSWAAGHAGMFAPHLIEQGFDLKVCLVDAAIQGINAIRAVCSNARIVNVDPVCRVVAPIGQPELQQQCDEFNAVAVFQSWDMLCGRLLPELGGTRAHLDIIGVNYYWTNQWEWDSPETPLSDNDTRRWPLHKMIGNVWERYGGDLIITETSHIDERRADWLSEITCEAEVMLGQNIPLHGICLYPILGMPKWHAQDEWLNMGLWDLVSESGMLKRIPYGPMICALKKSQRLERSANYLGVETRGKPSTRL